MKNLLLFLALTCIAGAGHAQQKPAKPASSTVPTLKSRWSNSLGGPVSAAQVKQMVDSPLVVFDTRGKRYTVTAFTIRYWFNSSYKDEESGLQKTVREFRTYDFDGTDRLSDLWKESVRDNVKGSDEIVITRLLVKMPNQKSMLAPDLKFTIRE